jgi:PEP-CTERM motif
MKTVTYFATTMLVAASFSSAALALVPLTTTVSASGLPAADTEALLSSVATGNTAKTTNGSVAASSVSLAKFDTSTGILVGARVKVSGVTTANNAKVSGTVLGSGGGRTVDATTSMSGAISGTGFTSITNAATSANRNCSGGNCPNSPSNAATSNPGATLAGTAAIAAGSLASYAGAGSVELQRVGNGSATVTTGTGATSGLAEAFYSFAGGDYSIEYDYVNFASPSFDGASIVRSLNLDFGTRALGSGPVTLNFSLFNIGNASNAGVSLTSVNRDTSNAQFATTLSNFTGLAGGASQSYSVTFDVSQLGFQQDVFRLSLADFAPDGVGGQTYDLDINVSGTGFEDAVGGVPEPATWMTLIAGFGLVGVSARQRRGRGAVSA